MSSGTKQQAQAVILPRTLTLTVAQALQKNASLSTSDFVRVSDTAEAIQALTADQIAGLTNVDSFRAVGNTLALSAAQAIAMTSARVHPSSTITVSDSGGNIVAALGWLLDNIVNIGRINATDAKPLVLTAAQASALGARLSVDDIVNVVDTGANIAAGITALMALGARIDSLDASDGRLNLTARAAAHFRNRLSPDDTVNIIDEAGTGATGTTVPSAKTLTLTVAQALQRNASLASSDFVRISDTAEAIQALTPAQISNLTNVDSFHAVGDTLKLNALQAVVMTSVRMLASDKIVVSDSGSNINVNALLTGLQNNITNIDRIELTDTKPLVLTAAQARALGAKLSADGVVNVVDTGANIAAGLSALMAVGGRIAALDASDGTLNLTAQAGAYFGARLNAADNVKIVDGGAYISATVAKLAANIGNIDAIDATDVDPVKLTVAQKESITANKLTGNDTINIVDSSAAIVGAIKALIDDIGKIDGIDATDDGVIKLTVAQKNTITAARLASDDNIQIIDSGAAINANLAGLVKEIDKIDLIDATDATPIELTAAQFDIVTQSKLGPGDSLKISGVADGDKKTLTGFTGATFIGTIANATGKFEIIAGAGSQSIITAAGADTIAGGAGADVMTGGSGSDRFVFAAGTADTVAAAGSVAGVDRITDLVLNGNSGDQIDLTLSVGSVSAASVTGSVNEASFVANMNTLLSVPGTGFNTTAIGGVSAAIVVADSGTLSGRTYLAVDWNGDDRFTVEDFVIDITGVTLTTFNTGCFI
ncbi:MAG TPA: hypothetical protein VEC06_00745 [Paucimonas sp.]|nr:hypothetical protein [Paucimonas sp.]